jgi:hypothetical protein
MCNQYRFQLSIISTTGEVTYESAFTPMLAYDPGWNCRTRQVETWRVVKANEPALRRWGYWRDEFLGLHASRSKLIVGESLERGRASARMAHASACSSAGFRHTTTEGSRTSFRHRASRKSIGLRKCGNRIGPIPHRTACVAQYSQTWRSSARTWHILGSSLPASAGTPCADRGVGASALQNLRRAGSI